MKTKLKKTLKIVGFLFFNLLVFLLGMYAYKNENIRSKIFSVARLKNISYSNYRTGQNSDPKSLELIISDSSKAIITACKENALKDGILRDENKIEVPAFLVYSADTFKIVMRLKGDYPDHWNGEKLSYRIKIKGENRLFGMKSFSLQDPETRNYLSEWYYHKILEEEELIALRYGFLTLNENGVSKGIYAIEESFDKQLIENNDRKEAPILKLDESILIDSSIINYHQTYTQENLYLMSKVDVFKSKRTLKDPLLYNQFKKGKKLIEQLKRREISLNTAIDIDKAAKLFAISDLIGGHHGLRWKNVRFYYNPSIGKLELIGFDSNSGHYIPDIYYNLWSKNNLGIYDVLKWKTIFFEDKMFVKSYFKYLSKYSNPEYLERFHTKIKPEMNLYLSYMHKENSMYNFFLKHYIRNASLISMKVDEYNKAHQTIFNEYFVEIKAEKPFELSSTKIELSLRNNGLDSIIVLGIFNQYEEKISLQKGLYIPGRENNLNATDVSLIFDLHNGLDTINLKTKRNNNRWVYKKIKVGYKFLSQKDTFYTKIEHYYDTHHDLNLNFNLNEGEFYTINHKAKTVSITQGNWVLDKNLVTPQGYTVICKKNTSIDIINNSIISVNGNVQFIGTEDNPINFTSSDSSGTILVYQSMVTSNLKHVNFYGLAEAHSYIWHLSGGVNFYEADVNLDYVNFKNNNSEDALNIVRSNFILNNASFEQIKSDAFDGDFCSGKILNSSFNIIGNDAIDFSGSEIYLFNINIINVGDKGISAGERSIITGNNIEITNAELGLVSKDLSYLNVNNIILKHISVPCAVFNKKKIFGPAMLTLTNYKVSNFVEEYLFETSSVVNINNSVVKPNHTDVSEVLYGKTYGKSSK